MFAGKGIYEIRHKQYVRYRCRSPEFENVVFQILCWKSRVETLLLVPFSVDVVVAAPVMVQAP